MGNGSLDRNESRPYDSLQRTKILNSIRMNYPAASSGVSKTTTGKTLRPKGRGIHPDGNKRREDRRIGVTIGDAEEKSGE